LSAWVIDLEVFFKVDVFVSKGRAYDREALARRGREEVKSTPPISAYIASAEDILLAKLEWFRAGGQASERQWRDILGICKLQMFALDDAYLRHWARDLKVLDLLDKALDEVGFYERDAHTPQS
jgi:hypothetical protein